ncbi:MAG: alginate lyase family protein [Pyrinomonadaceae bacterium]
MSNPLENIKKLKGSSWQEIKTRGSQAVYGYTDQIRLTGKLPTDQEFLKLLDKSAFGTKSVSAEILYEKFYENSLVSFFSSFAEKEKTLELFRHHFGEKSARYFIEKADEIIKGRFDLLGYINLDFGAEVDWHLEPVSGKRSPLKHWKQFDEIGTRETGDKKIIWELNRHQHFFTLGVAFWLTKDEIYAETFARHLESWMIQNPPETGINWLSSLEISFRVMSWIWAFHFFKDAESFSPALFQKALKFLYLQGRHIEKYLSTYYSPNTHLTGEALGLYSPGPQLPFFNRSEIWQTTGEEILFAELDKQILDDGVYFEQTTWYQRYTADFYTHFLILKTLQNDKISAELQNKLSEKLQKQLDFLMHITRPDGTTPLIGDDDGGKILPHSRTRSDDFRTTLTTGAVLFERGDYKFVAEHLSEEMIWLLGLEGVLSFETLRALKPEQNSAAFKDGGYFVMRDGWEKTDNFLLVDAGFLGSMNGGHGHADALSIELAAAGRTLLVDSGTCTYHDPVEMRYHFRSTAAHNTLTIDENSSSEQGGKFSWLTKAETNLESWISKERFDFFSASHDGYERFVENPARHSREILFLKNDYWIMRDFVETRGEHDYTLNFHFNMETAPKVEQSENGNFCVSESSHGQTGLRLFTFDSGEWKSNESWISNCYGERVNAPLRLFVSSGIGNQEFFTFLLPSDDGLPKPEVFETPVAGGRAFIIKFRDYTDLLVFADGDQIVRTEFFNTNFRFTWARLYADENLPEEFILINGSKFSIGVREVLDYPKNLEFATARRFGSKINVQASETIFSVSLPKSRSTKLIYKDPDQPEDIFDF